MEVELLKIAMIAIKNRNIAQNTSKQKLTKPIPSKKCSIAHRKYSRPKLSNSWILSIFMLSNGMLSKLKSYSIQLLSVI